MQCNAAPDGTDIPPDPGPRTSNFLRAHVFFGWAAEDPWTGWESLDRAESSPVASLIQISDSLTSSLQSPVTNKPFAARGSAPRAHNWPDGTCKPKPGPWLWARGRALATRTAGPALGQARRGRSSACLFHRRRPGLTRQQGSHRSLILRGFFGFVCATRES